jgi:outer membrane protein assembly factor BamB
MVVASTNQCGTEAFDWQAAPGAGFLRRWYNPATSECFLSSPAVSVAGEVVVGMSCGFVWSYALDTGKQNWFYRADEPVLATAAFYAGVSDVYAVGLNHVHYLINGALAQKPALPASTVASPAATWTRIFVSTRSGLRAFSPDLTTFQTDGAISGGMSSPAVASDGTVYVVTSGGELIAYRGR